MEEGCEAVVREEAEEQDFLVGFLAEMGSKGVCEAEVGGGAVEECWERLGG